MAHKSIVIEQPTEELPTSEILATKRKKQPVVATAERVGKKRGRKAKDTQVPGVFQRSFKRERPDKSIYHYVGKIWYIYYCGLDGKTGKAKMIYESSGSEDKKVAEELLKRRQGEVILLKKPHVSNKKDITLGEYIDQYYLTDSEVLEQGGITEKTRILNQVKEARLGHIKLNKLTADDVKEYLKYKNDNRRAVLQARNPDEIYPENRTVLSQSTINNQISTIKRIINHANEENGMVSDYVIGQMSRINKKDPKNSRITCLTLDEITKLKEECGKHSPELRQIVEFALATGIRQGKILSMKWNMVRQNLTYLDIPKDKNGDAFRNQIGSTAIKVLKERLAVKLDDCPYVFYKPGTTEMWKDISEGYEMAVKRAGIEDFTFHDLRHTFISQLVRSGTKIAVVQKLANHKTIQQTMKYTFLDPETIEDGINQLPY
jgi:integrase